METFSRETLLPQATEPLDPRYVTGLAEGKGSFTYSRSGHQLALYFAIKLTSADRSLLHLVRDFFKAGKLYEVKPAGPGPRAGNTRPAVYYYRVTRRDELSRIVEHFDRYPLAGHKRASYAIWRQIVELKRQHYRGPPREELHHLAEALSATNHLRP